MPRRTYAPRNGMSSRRLASMRPGRNAPENGEDGVRTPRGAALASMRPGRNAPENVLVVGIAALFIYRFNEAGAKCPGEPSARPRNSSARPRFNEAGAKCPGERRGQRKGRVRLARFNEAGAKCPGERGSP